jgi:hypothetical protein
VLYENDVEELTAAGEENQNEELRDIYIAGRSINSLRICVWSSGFNRHHDRTSATAAGCARRSCKPWPGIHVDIRILASHWRPLQMA